MSSSCRHPEKDRLLSIHPLTTAARYLPHHNLTAAALYSPHRDRDILSLLGIHLSRSYICSYSSSTFSSSGSGTSCSEFTSPGLGSYFVLITRIWLRLPSTYLPHSPTGTLATAAPMSAVSRDSPHQDCIACVAQYSSQQDLATTPQYSGTK